jgi:glycerophosphoryl diester phosphodiesterase
VTAVYAHRGASTEYPENTLAAFRRAMELGAAGIELDVHLSADGVPVVIHDWTVDRTKDGIGLVSEMTITELKSLDAGGGEKIPTLAEVLDLMGNELHLGIEVKANKVAEAVVREIRGRNIRCTILSFDWNTLRYVRMQDPDVELWVTTIVASEEAIAVAKELGATALSVFHNALDEDIAGYLKEQDLGFWVRTVNEPERALTCAGWGAIGICTDDPAAIQQTLGERHPQT